MSVSPPIAPRVFNRTVAPTPPVPSQFAEFLERPITRDEALALYRNADLYDLALLANAAKAKFHAPEAPVTFVIDRNVNYTNICNVDCSFCAFYRHPEAEDAYTHGYDIIRQKAQELLDAGGTQLLLQGGVNPDLPFDFYTTLIGNLKRDFPTLTLHAFSPTEIEGMMEITGKDARWVLSHLIEAGISSIPGGGAEILHDDVRRKVSHKKTGSAMWLHIMGTAHELGLKTSATMMFGMVEKDWQRVESLFRIREQQEATGGFTAFIPWTFQKVNTNLEKLPVHFTATGMDYLRLLALSRIVLHNIPHIQSSWITQGIKLGQTGLYFGADDLGGLLLEENVVTQAGITASTRSIDEMVALIHQTGHDAAQRDTQYRIIHQYPLHLSGCP